MKWQDCYFDRGKLYDQVWERPVYKVAKDYGITDVALKKVCKKLSIPTPWLGYWAKIQHGHVVQKPPLPHMNEDDRNRVPLPKGHRPGYYDDEEPSDKIQAEKTEARRIVVEKKLDSIDPLISYYLNHISSIVPNYEGLLIPMVKGSLNIQVSNENIDRSVRIMESLIKALHNRGYTITFRIDGSSVYAVVGELIPFDLVERVDKEERPLTEEEEKKRQRRPWLYRDPVYSYTPNGRLALRIKVDGELHCRKTWTDTKRIPLENSLNGFMTSLIRVSATLKALRIEREERERKWAEKEKQQALERKREELNKKKLNSLIQDTENWHKAERLRDYLQAVSERAVVEGTANDPGIKEWMKWAKDYANSLDPLREDYPISELEEVDMDSVIKRLNPKWYWW